ncbi:MAG: ABC transporter ATP-binding protein [Nitriliruptor sp.]|nr:MAG: ABC transporter ATP-binding protein [Nitriliruptor sp.]
MAPTPAPAAPPLRRLWHYAGGHRRDVIVAATWSILNAILDIAPPFLIGIAVDIVVVQEGSFVARISGVSDLRGQFLVLGGLTVVIWLLESLTEYLADVRWRNLAQSIQHDARMDAYTNVQDLDLAAFEDRSTGSLLSVLNDDVNQLERFLDRGAQQLLQVATSVLLIGITYLVLSPVIGLLAFLPVPVVLWVTLRYQRRLEPKYAAVREQVGVVNAALNNNLGGIATIKAFGAEPRERERIRQESQRYREVNREAIRLSSAFVPLVRVAILAGFTAILILGGLQAIDGRLEVGAYSVMVFIVQRLLWPLTRLGETFDLYQRAMASTRRILDLIEQPIGLTDGTEPLPEVAGEVRFDGVRFAYDRRSAEAASSDTSAAPVEVLRGVDLHVPAGETHAIVGSTGAGKSTIVKLLLRLEDVTDGVVSIDGHDVRDVRTADLRSACGLVSQDVFLFHGSVRENLVYGAPDASDIEVARAAELAEAHEFVLALPEGYDTVVGERGVKLSGGQRQRLSIARAILRDPAILLLDEATSAVDNETEAAIQRSLVRVAQDRTTIVIAHRLSTVRHADRIHVLEDGCVVEAGTHDELVACDGRYAALWRVQTGELIDVAPAPSASDPASAAALTPERSACR